MYILFIARGCPSERYKTNGIFEFDQAKALTKAGHKLVYLAVDTHSLRRWRKWGLERRTEGAIDIYILNLPLGNLPRMILSNFVSWGLGRLYKRVLKDHGRPDIVHSHFVRPSYAVSKVREIMENPFLVTEHSSRIHRDHIGANFYKMASEAYQKADAVVAVSPSLVASIEEKFNIQASFIPNIVDTGIFTYREREKKDDFVFVSTGNLIGLKNMDLMIEAFHGAFGGNENIKLHIFGKGPLKEQLEDMILKYGLENQVKLMGLTSREEIAEFYKKADCFVLASKSETFGVAYIEALAMGIPVIATRCGGPETFVNEGNGLLVDVDNREDLEVAMKKIYDNIDSYKSMDISRQIVENYSGQAFLERILEIYKVARSRKQKN